MEDTATRMAAAIRHRGPDDAGVWADPSAGIAVAHRRLSIIDLSAAGHQPMLSADGRYVLVFNGEVYNHLALRAELVASGRPARWRGYSDTETLLESFSAWGVAATLQRAVGMFALALWDRDERRLMLARDRLGEKPLYYGWVGAGPVQALVFGSELKALRAYPGFDNPVCRDALALYMQYGAVPAPYCIYEGVLKLPPACVLSMRLDDFHAKSARIAPYWSLAEVARRGLADPLHDEAEAVAELDATLRQSVRMQAVADVPLGAFLSGGVDSSAIAALMQAQSSRPILTFTVGFEEAGFNEAPQARAVARHLGSDHHELHMSWTDALAVIPDLPALYDEPFADSSQIPTFLICRMARQHVTVALSGDAGDELFGGYNRYFWARRIWNKFGWSPPALRSGLCSAIQRIPASAWDAIGDALPGKNGVARLGDKAHKLARRLDGVASLDDLYRKLLTEWPQWAELVPGSRARPTTLDDASIVDGVSEPEHRMMLLDSLSYLPDDILTKVDRAGMGVSLEGRVPFLDHRVVELAWRMPLKFKIRGGQGKWALRQVLYQYVPRELIERPKSGFEIPIGQWLRGPLRDWAENLLDERRLEREGYFEPALVQTTWRQHLSGHSDWSARLWTVLMFQAWLEANASPEKSSPSSASPLEPQCAAAS